MLIKRTLYMSHIISFSFLVRRFTLCVGLMFFINTSNAQRVKLHYDLKKDRVWVENQKRILQKGFELDTYNRNNYLKQLKYFKVCINLGRYYEAMYDKEKINSMKKSVYYYEKVADFGRFPDEEKYFKALALRNSVLRKLADIYFVGKGVLRDREKSIDMALRGSSGYDGYFAYYSKRYFKCNCIILGKEIVNDSFYTLKFNPFALQSNLMKINIFDKYLNIIANKFKSVLKADSLSYLYIFAYPQMSYKSQYQFNQILDNIKSYYVMLNIPNDKIFIEARIDGGDYKTIDWFITKVPPP